MTTLEIQVLLSRVRNKSPSVRHSFLKAPLEGLLLLLLLQDSCHLQSTRMRTRQKGKTRLRATCLSRLAYCVPTSDIRKAIVEAYYIYI